MCVVSMIVDHYTNKWTEKWHEQQSTLEPIPLVSPITQEEVDEFRRLLQRAREYDKRTGQPDCELDEKRHVLKKLAEQLGVEIEFL